MIFFSAILFFTTVKFNQKTQSSLTLEMGLSLESHLQNFRDYKNLNLYSMLFHLKASYASYIQQIPVVNLVVFYVAINFKRRINKNKIGFIEGIFIR